MGPRDLLLHRRQEALRIEEPTKCESFRKNLNKSIRQQLMKGGEYSYHKPGHPVAVGLAAGEPAPELGVPEQ